MYNSGMAVTSQYGIDKNLFAWPLALPVSGNRHKAEVTQRGFVFEGMIMDGDNGG